MILNPFNECIHIILHVTISQGVVQVTQITPQLFFFFHQVHLKTLVCQPQRGRHARGSSPDYQGPFSDGELLFLEGFYICRCSYSHPHQVPCLFGGFLFLIHVYP